jgi:hypothetical protein
MAETKALILQLRPKREELRDEQTYTEEEVKRILFGFARDLGCKWSDDELYEFIETVFE